MYKRSPCVAGQFYPASAVDVTALMKAFVDRTLTTEKAVAVMLPHAGYIFSGRTAGKTISRVIVPETVVLIGPNHTGEGAPVSVMPEGIWVTPLGDVPVDATLARAIIASSKVFAADMRAHGSEHSLEVELPFLKYLNTSVKIVPITIGTHDLTTLAAVGKGLAAVVKGRDVLTVISSDMTHYETQETAERKDKHAIAAVCALDETQLAEVVEAENISMCGFAPAYAAIVAAKLLGATAGTLVDYCTSADVTGDTKKVVGYAGIVIR